LTFVDEKDLQQQLSTYLKTQGWWIKEQLTSDRNGDRLDLATTREDCGNKIIGLELKVPKNQSDLTKALVQLIRYRKQWFGLKIDQFAVMIPYPLDMISTRFFWRFGFGVGSYHHISDYYQPEVVFVNGEVENTIFLMKPRENAYFHFNTPEKVTRIIDSMKKYEDEE